VEKQPHNCKGCVNRPLNFIGIAIIFSEKRIESINFVPSQ
jgi:hypothetical protein